MGSHSEDEKDQLLALMDDGRIAIFTAWGFLIPTVSWAEVNDYHIRYLKTLNGFKENNCIKIVGDYIKITDKGEDVKKQLYNKIELRRQEIKSQQQSKVPLGFQPPS